MTYQSNITYIKFLNQSGINFFQQNQHNNFYLKDQNSKNYKIGHINSVNSLDKLKILIENSNICELNNKYNKTILGTGNINSKILFITGAPSSDEENQNRPLVGKSGELFAKMLKAIELSEDKIYISLSIPWKTPNNRKPTNNEILNCLPFIQKQIEIISPSIIVLLGEIAIKSILTSNKIMEEVVGNWLLYKTPMLKDSIPTIATFHPEFLLDNKSYKKLSWQHLKKIQQKIINEKI